MGGRASARARRVGLVPWWVGGAGDERVHAPVGALEAGGLSKAVTAFLS